MAAIDIRKELSKFLDDYGYPIIYVRRDLRFRCSCYSERSGESSNPNCPKCFGTSYAVQVERIRSRRSASQIPETKAGARNSGDGGEIHVSAYVYYMEYNIEPKTGDLIMEVEWNNNLPSKIKEKLEISIAEPKEGYQGRIEFYQVYCRTHWLGVNDNDTLTSN